MVDDKLDFIRQRLSHNELLEEAEVADAARVELKLMRMKAQIELLEEKMVEVTARLEKYEAARLEKATASNSAKSSRWKRSHVHVDQLQMVSKAPCCLLHETAVKAT